MFEITMQGPAKNALGSAMLSWLLERLTEAGGRPVLLTGTGDSFSAGLNLKEIVSFDEAGMRDFLHLLERVVCALYQYPGPTVALVNGHAIAGGCVLALACDHRVALDDAKIKIGLNEVALGLRFPPRILSMVRQRVPPHHLSRVVLGAGLFESKTALALGLVDEISADPGALARARLEELARHPKAAYALGKRDLRGTQPEDLSGEPDEELFFLESLSVWTSPELKAKIAAMFKK